MFSLSTLSTLAASPLLWIGATVIFLLCAIYVSDGMSRRWHDTGMWLPIGLLAALALRPYPRVQQAEAPEPEPHLQSQFDVRSLAHREVEPLDLEAEDLQEIELEIEELEPSDCGR